MTDPDPPRTEFGHARAPDCACGACVENCAVVPGYLVPADLVRLAPAGGDLLTWAESHLLASPGAVVARVAPDGSVERFRVPTLVPARGPGGACHWLDPGTRSCTVHAVSPFGCAFFGCGLRGGQSDARSRDGLVAVIEAWLDPAAAYPRVWHWLHAAGLVSPPPEDLRKAAAVRRLKASGGYY